METHKAQVFLSVRIAMDKDAGTHQSFETRVGTVDIAADLVDVIPWLQHAL